MKYWLDDSCVSSYRSVQVLLLPSLLLLWLALIFLQLHVDVEQELESLKLEEQVLSRQGRGWFTTC